MIEITDEQMTRLRELCDEFGVVKLELFSIVLVRLATERQITMVIEALNRAHELDPERVQAIPDLQDLRGMRNHVVHRYDKTDHEIVYDAVIADFPLLRERLESLMRSAGWRDDNTLAPE